jgi:hypothetical protein
VTDLAAGFAAALSAETAVGGGAFLGVLRYSSISVDSQWACMRIAYLYVGILNGAVYLPPFQGIYICMFRNSLVVAC